MTPTLTPHHTPAFPSVEIVEILTRVYQRVWAEREPQKLDEWSEAHRIFPKKAGAEIGGQQWTTPGYLREIMRTFGDPFYVQLTIMKPSQVYVTEATVINGVLWKVDQQPGPTLLIYPNAKLARRTIKKRIIPGAAEIAVLDGRLGTGKEDRTAESLVFDSMDVLATGAGSEANLRSTSFQTVIIDDADLCPEGTVEEASQRMGAYEPSQLVVQGTPGLAGRGLDRQYQLGDRRRYHVPCPHCGFFQELVWQNLCWEGGLEAEATIVRDTAWMRCVNKKCTAHPKEAGLKGDAIHSHHKAWMDQRGLWLRAGESIVHKLKPEQLPVTRGIRDNLEGTGVSIVGEAPRTRHASFSISGLYAPKKPFGWIAEEYIKHQGSPPPVWWNGKLGVGWAMKGDSLDLKRLGELRAASKFDMGRAPHPEDPELQIVCVVNCLDIQADHAWLLTLGFTEGGTHVYWLWSERIEAPPGQNLWTVAKRCATLSIPCADGRVLTPLITACDSGHRTKEVYELCAAMGRGKWFPVKGAGQTPEGAAGRVSGDIRVGQPYWPSKIEKNPEGKPIPGGLMLLHVNGAWWTEQLFGMLDNAHEALKPESAPSVNEPIAGVLIRPPGRFFIPRNLPDEHMAMLESEQLVEQQWVFKPGRRDNHLTDCGRYGLAIAGWGGIRRFTRAMARIGGAVPAPAEQPAVSLQPQQARARDPVLDRFRYRRGR